MKRLFALCILSLVLLVGLQACDINIGTTGTGTSTPTPGSTATTTATPTTPATATPTPTSAGGAMTAQITAVITAYYNDVEAKKYTEAYTFLDPTATDMNGKVITQSSFLQLAQQMDSNEGPVVSYSIGIFPPSPMVTMTVMRSHLGPYHAQLNMKQEDATWKITSLDRI